ncbi:uncharacterized protein LOC116324333 isoform X1 [Oreochromis aureus]|uniref:uncharacterized protein LOC116324333 isoform X1 n=2 Tax=Oreochromis aureus TaxID=47969 RepID=UPI001954480B|nr:uncharacterized protein LOC116324333 isoform X1 [Oreochromis aureus]
MLVVVLLLMMMMKSDGAADIIRMSANSSTSVVLPSGLQGDPRTRGYDVRWTQIPHLLLNWNRSTCSHGRCSMLPDGSLEFSRLQTQDSGSYTLEVFDKTGSRLQTKDFLLQVTGFAQPAKSDGGVNTAFSRKMEETTDWVALHPAGRARNPPAVGADHSSSHVVSSVSVCVVLLVLLLFFIVVFILRKRRVQRKMTTGQKEEKEENIYVVMKGCQGNKNNEEEKEKKLEKEEEPLYVPCSPTVSSQHEDSVYV